MKLFPGRPFALLSATLLLLTLSGCADLGAVREWSDKSLQAAQFSEIVTTYAETPNRMAIYDEDNRDSWEQQSALRRDQAMALELQLQLVAEYMGALKALASDTQVDFSSGLGKLESALGKTQMVSRDTLGAAGSLVATISSAAAQAWQKQKVAELVESANAPLQTILSGELRSIVEEDFTRDLKAEELMIGSYYKQLLRVGDGSPAANASLKEWYVIRTQENTLRSKAVAGYLQVLTLIAEGHQALYDGRNDIDAVELSKQLFDLANKIQSNVKELLKT